MSDLWPAALLLRKQNSNEVRNLDDHFDNLTILKAFKT